MVRPNILIVDDEKQYCTVISDLLKSYGCDVHVANDAGDALFRLKNSIPDLILMDIMMPEIDGLTLIGRLRLMDKWSKIPIIAISAYPNRETNANGSKIQSTARIERKAIRQKRTTAP